VWRIYSIAVARLIFEESNECGQLAQEHICVQLHVDPELSLSLFQFGKAKEPKRERFPKSDNGHTGRVADLCPIVCPSKMARHRFPLLSFF
jgi:hypothetical protein